MCRPKGGYAAGISLAYRETSRSFVPKEMGKPGHFPVGNGLAKRIIVQTQKNVPFRTLSTDLNKPIGETIILSCACDFRSVRDVAITNAVETFPTFLSFYRRNLISSYSTGTSKYLMVRTASPVRAIRTSQTDPQESSSLFPILSENCVFL